MKRDPRQVVANVQSGLNLRRIVCMLGLRLAVAVAVVAGGFGAANAATGNEAANAAVDAGSAAPAGAGASDVGGQAKSGEDVGGVRHARVSPLDRRVALLAKELGLDAAQQIKVKAVLEGQREQVARVWSDSATPSAVRISRTQAIADRTADQIRALLNDEQRTRYVKAHQHDVPVGAPGGDVQTWMRSAQGAERAQTATAGAPATAKGN
jgi:hypothetical protein